MEISDKKLEEILTSAGLVSADQIARAYEQQRKQGGALQKSLTSLGLLDEDTITSTVLASANISYLRLKNYPIRPEIAKMIPRKKCVSHKAIPISLSRDLLTVAMADPFNVVILDDIHILTKKEILPVYAREAEILEAIEKHHPRDRMTMTDVVEQIDTMESDFGTLATLPEVQGIKGDEEDEHSPVIVLLANKIIEEAYHQGASDIHVEHREPKTSVRYRIDGVLREVLALPTKVKLSLVARLKIMSELDIAEKRLPQDGRISYKKFTKSNVDIDIRVSVMPTTWGEKVVMRLLDRQKESASLDQMGFLPDSLATYRTWIRKPWGMILHVGPTGSGKTTTLYGALAEINQPGVNIQTAEDPIEYNLAGINQTQIHSDIGFTFARALRGFLRQDPNIIMVGEIRDLETAKIATEAALTGHILFSTLHTNDAPQTVTRLLEIGVEPFLISATLLGICAQRLVRRLCRCKLKYEPTPEELRLIAASGPVPFLYKSRGCGICRNTGYKGRIGIHELLTVTNELKTAINERTPAIEIKRIATAQGMRTLHQDAALKVVEGITSVDEVLRAVQED